MNVPSHVGLRPSESDQPRLTVQVLANGPELVAAEVTGAVTRDALLLDKAPEENLHEVAAGKSVLLSLSGATTVDSAGVSWLIRLHRRCAQDQGRLIIHSIPPVIDRTLRLLNMHMVFTLAKDESTARRLAAGETER